MTLLYVWVVDGRRAEDPLRRGVAVHRARLERDEPRLGSVFSLAEIVYAVGRREADEILAGRRPEWSKVRPSGRGWTTLRDGVRGLRGAAAADAGFARRIAEVDRVWLPGPHGRDDTAWAPGPLALAEAFLKEEAAARPARARKGRP